jgi:hypothetical protein
MPLKVGTAEHWLTRAQEARSLAEKMDDPIAKQAMLEIADAYVKIANRASAQAKQAG